MFFGCTNYPITSRTFYNKLFYIPSFFSLENFLKIFIAVYVLYFWYLVLIFFLQILLPPIFMKFGWKKRICPKECKPATCTCSDCKKQLPPGRSEKLEESDKKEDNH